MSIANVVCRGYGPSATIAFVVTRGYGSGTPIPPLAAPAESRGGIYPKIIERKGRLRRDEEPRSPSVRETIDRILRGPEPEPRENPIEVPALEVRPPLLLTDAERAQVATALAAVPEERLIAYGLEDAVNAAVALIKDLERDDEEAMVLILTAVLN